jgi:hypothetical protein
MTSQIPFAPLTPESLARLTPAEQHAFAVASEYLAGSQKPPLGVIVTLAETIRRLITGPPAAALEPAGEPLTAAQCDRLRREVAEWDGALSAVRLALDLTEARTDGHAEIIAAGREGLRVLSGEEGSAS